MRFAERAPRPTAGALAALLLVALLPSCGGTRSMLDDERQLVAWFIEDVAHAAPRRVEELQLAAPSPPMRRIAEWAMGGAIKEWRASDSVHDDYLPPQQLAARRTRWPALHALFSSHAAVVLANGLVAAKPDLSADDMAATLPVIDSENHTRRSLDALLVTLADMHGAEAHGFLDLLARARVQLDLQNGAVLWPTSATK